MTLADALTLAKGDVIESRIGGRMTVTMTLPDRPGFYPTVMAWKDGNRQTGHSACFVLDNSERTQKELSYWTKVA